jgi:hypothetical protein
MPRARGSKNRQTVERETAKKIAAARAELVTNAPPLDFSMLLDSLGMMEHVIRHFYFRAKIAERLGDRVDRRRANAAFMQAVRPAEKVVRYRHAQLSAIKLAGDINAKVTDSASLDELIAKLKGELHKLVPIIDLDLRASRRGREPRAADCGESNHPARLAFRGLSSAGFLLLRLLRPLVLFGAEGLPGGYRPASGSGAWAAPRPGQLAALGHRNLPARQCPRAGAREEYAAYCVADLSDKLADAGG